MSFEYWFMFPVAILVATTAMASGVGGATFFAGAHVRDTGPSNDADSVYFETRLEF